MRTEPRISSLIVRTLMLTNSNVQTAKSKKPPKGLATLAEFIYPEIAQERFLGK